jgi:hypothetical protein
MVELIEQRQPAVMLCHWPGLYCNGSLAGYRDFQKVVLALEGRFKNQTQWMKVSDIGRYWTAKEFTQVERTESKIRFKAPFSCQDFTVQIDTRQQVEKVLVEQAGKTVACEPVPDNSRLLTNRYFREPGKVTVCFELLKGNNQIELVGNV